VKNTVPATAMPVAVPSWAVVFTTPDAAPACSGRMPDVAAVNSAFSTAPTPGPTAITGTSSAHPLNAGPSHGTRTAIAASSTRTATAVKARPNPGASRMARTLPTTMPRRPPPD
jgi:hypothetical protein